MPETLNIKETLDKRDIVSHAFIAAITPSMFDTDYWIEHKEVDVKLTFNDIEVPFVEFLERFNKQADEWVETQAYKLMENKL